MSLIRLFFLTYGGRIFKLALYLAGVDLAPDHADVVAVRAIIARLSAALGTKATSNSTDIIAATGANVTATSSAYSDDQDKFRPTFKSAEGTTVRYNLPSPINMFMSDHIRVDTTNSAFVTWKAAAEALFQSPSGGALTFRQGKRGRTLKGGRA